MDDGVAVADDGQHQFLALRERDQGREGRGGRESDGLSVRDPDVGAAVISGGPMEGEAPALVLENVELSPRQVDGCFPREIDPALQRGPGQAVEPEGRHISAVEHERVRCAVIRHDNATALTRAPREAAVVHGGPATKIRRGEAEAAEGGGAVGGVESGKEGQRAVHDSHQGSIHYGGGVLGVVGRDQHGGEERQEQRRHSELLARQHPND